MKAISVKSTIGLGDAIQFSSVPENYYRATGELLIDIGNHWMFDFNPYVRREPGLDREQIIKKWKLKPEDVVEMWNYGMPQPRPPGRDFVYLSMAERHASIFKVPVVMKYPRLYRFEEFPFEKREKILLHTHGKSHGAMPDHVIEHVLKKYKHMPIYHIGLPSDPDLGIPKIVTPTFWDLAETISQARLYIGVDSGPSWVACCYPDVQVKKVRVKPTVDRFKDWVPLQIDNIHSHWDDRMFTVHNISGDDVGFTSSYKRL